MKRTACLLIMIITIIICPVIVGAESQNANITRDELANLVMETYEYITQEFIMPISERPVFFDISQSEYADRIYQVYAIGFMNGVGDEMFLPDEQANRVQVAATFYRLLKRVNAKYGINSDKNVELTVKDTANIPEWSINAVFCMVSMDFMKLDEQNFKPDDKVDKSEACNIAEKIKEKYSDLYSGERIDYKSFLSGIK